MADPSPPSAGDAPVRRRRRSRRRRHRSEDPTIWALVAIVAVTAGAVSAIWSRNLTGIGAVDAVLTAALTAVVAAAGARAQRWTWLWIGGLATALTIGTTWLPVGAAALLVATVGMSLRDRHPVVGAAATGTATIALAHGDTTLPTGVPVAVALVAVGPVLWSAYQVSHRREQRRIRRALVGLVLGAMAASVLLGVSALAARSSLEDAVDLSQQAMSALRSGEQEQAGALFAEAELQFAAAADHLTAPWALPGRMVPVVAQQAVAATEIAESGRDLASSASDAATTAPYDQLRAAGGGIDLDLVRSMQDPVAASAAELRAAEERTAEVDSPWLLPPARDALDRFRGEVVETLPDAELADEALQALPRLLGGDGTQRYFVAFANPAEGRFQGGFIGAYGELEATDGKVDLVRSGPIGELNPSDGDPPRSLGDLRTYQERYGRFRPWRFMQNLTASPDWPSNAEAIAELYPQAGGSDLDGALYIDPVGLAALLELTGQVQVGERTLTDDNVVAYLTVEQYVDSQFASDAEQEQALVDAADATFDALLERELPSPRTIGQVLGPAVRGGHLQFTTFDEADRSFLERLDVDGAFSEREGKDWLAVRTANDGLNKLDPYLEREVDYRVAVDPETGLLTAAARVTLRNTAPEGLPPYVENNNKGAPQGTNVAYLSVFTPHKLVGWDLDGEQVPIEPQRELGGNTYSLLVDVPRGEARTLELDLEGQVPAGPTYELVVDAQSRLRTDRTTVEIRSANAAWRAGEAEGGTVEDGQVSATFDQPGDHTTWVEWTESG